MQFCYQDLGTGGRNVTGALVIATTPTFVTIENIYAILLPGPWNRRPGCNGGICYCNHHDFCNSWSGARQGAPAAAILLAAFTAVIVS